VNAADYTVWRNSLGQTGLVAYSGADGNGDSAITRLDCDVWKAHYGQTVPAMGAGADSQAAGDDSQPSLAASALLAEVVIGAKTPPRNGEGNVGVASTIPLTDSSFALPLISMAAQMVTRRSLTPALSRRERESNREWQSRSELHDAALL